jgi:histone H3/H4
MLRRLEAYRKANNSQIAEPSVQQLFKERGVDRIHEVNTTEVSEKAMKGLQIYVERVSSGINHRKWRLFASIVIPITKMTKVYLFQFLRDYLYFEDICKISMNIIIESIKDGLN